VRRGGCGVLPQLDATACRNVDGITFPTSRGAYDQLSPDHPLMVAIDMTNLTFR